MVVVSYLATWVLTKTNVLESGSVYTFIFQVGRNMQFSNITCFGKSRKLCIQGVVYTVAPLEGGHYTELQYMQPSHRLPRQTPKACCHNNLSNSPECRTARKHKQKAITRWIGELSPCQNRDCVAHSENCHPAKVMNMTWSSDQKISLSRWFLFVNSSKALYTI